jgi:hypothetical protein
MATATQIRDEIYETDVPIAFNHLLKYSKKDLEILIAGIKDPNSRIGEEVTRKTNERNYQDVGIIVKIDGHRAQVQWAENKTWYALSKLTEVCF